MNRHLRATVAGACLTLLLGVGSSHPVLANPGQGAPPRCNKDFCVEDEQTRPAQSDHPATPVNSNGSPPQCVWRQEPPPGFDANSGPTTFFELRGEQMPNSYVVYEFCGDQFSGRLQWVTPDAAAPLPTPDELAQVVYVRLEGDLPAPAVSSDPAPDEAAIVSVPTFVAVSNWTGTVTDEECDPTGALCVSVTATPALSFSPSEPGAPTVACAGAGSRFAEGGGDSVVQAAAPGACTYAYRVRTGTSDRPEAWPGTVTTTWELVWQSTSGSAGTLPDIAKTASLPRQVHEVQTVIER